MLFPAFVLKTVNFADADSLFRDDREGERGRGIMEGENSYIEGRD